jgi:hypothetical protein
MFCGIYISSSWEWTSERRKEEGIYTPVCHMTELGVFVQGTICIRTEGMSHKRRKGFLRSIKRNCGASVANAQKWNVSRHIKGNVIFSYWSERGTERSCLVWDFIELAAQQLLLWSKWTKAPVVTSILRELAPKRPRHPTQTPPNYVTR